MSKETLRLVRRASVKFVITTSELVIVILPKLLLAIAALNTVCTEEVNWEDVTPAIETVTEILISLATVGTGVGDVGACVGVVLVGAAVGATPEPEPSARRVPKLRLS